MTLCIQNNGCHIEQLKKIHTREDIDEDDSDIVEADDKVEDDIYET